MPEPLLHLRYLILVLYPTMVIDTQPSYLPRKTGIPYRTHYVECRFFQMIDDKLYRIER